AAPTARYRSAAGDFLLSFQLPDQGRGGASFLNLTPVALEPPKSVPALESLNTVSVPVSECTT
ncbi:MAG: hypothetical protein WCI95_12020, partial [bacterium]